MNERQDDSAPKSKLELDLENIRLALERLERRVNEAITLIKRNGA